MSAIPIDLKNEDGSCYYCNYPHKGKCPLISSITYGGDPDDEYISAVEFHPRSPQDFQRSQNQRYPGEEILRK